MTSNALHRSRLGRLARRARLLPRLLSASRGLMGRVEGIQSDLAEVRGALPRLTGLAFDEAGALVLEAQREITEHTTVAFYPERYRGEELLYWLHLPGWILEWSRAARPRRVVDVGCGYGTLAVFAATATTAQVSGMDIQIARVPAEVADAHGLELVEGNVELMDLPWDGVDAILMTEIIEHFNFHPVPTMRRIGDAIGPGGRLFLSTPDADSWGRVTGDGAYASYRDMPQPDPAVPTVDIHVYQFTETELREVLELAGFRILRIARAPGRWGFHLNVEAERIAAFDSGSASLPAEDSD